MVWAVVRVKLFFVNKLSIWLVLDQGEENLSQVSNFLSQGLIHPWNENDPWPMIGPKMNKNSQF